MVELTAPVTVFKYGSYLVINLNRNKVVDLKLVQAAYVYYCVNEAKGSNDMENEDLQFS